VVYLTVLAPANASPNRLSFPINALKSKPASTWSAAQSEEFYGFKRWGSGHYLVDGEGFVAVQPRADGRNIRVLDVINEALGMGLKAPMVIRFQDLLRHRVIQLNEMFRKAIREEGYRGDYRGVFPIKVNQLREVVDEIIAAGKDYNYGLEAGSKPELMIVDAQLHDGSGVRAVETISRFAQIPHIFVCFEASRTENWLRLTDSRCFDYVDSIR